MIKRKRESTDLSGDSILDMLDELSELIYVVDLDTYDVLFINRPGKLSLGIQEATHLKCYEAIHGQSQKCDFCVNHLLTEHTFYNWEHYNRITRRYYLLKDKKIDWYGRKAKIQIAFDITDKEEEKQRLVHYLEAENLVTECAKEFYEMGDTAGAIQQILKKIGLFWEAGRVYLYQTEEPEAGMTHEWKSEEFSWKDRIQDYMSFFQRHWDHYFIGHPFVSIQDVKKLKISRPGAYQTLKELNIWSIFVLPLRIGNHLLGFLGMENYDIQKVSNVYGPLNSIAYFASYALRTNSLTRKLEKMSYTDLLTDTWNRNRFLRDQKEISLNCAAPVGIVFIDINDMKQINDQYGHKQGDFVLADLPNRIRDIFQEAQLYRVGGDEFIVICEGTDEKEFHEKVKMLKSLSQSQLGYTFSVGSDWAVRCDDIQKMMIAADQRMYMDKKQIR